MCGADAAGIPARKLAEGLPPRVRGRRFISGLRHVLQGTTPACAGQTNERSRQRTMVRDYPRVCGADLPQMQDIDPRMGLPPRVRGRRAADHGTVPEEGTTPACAGQTRTVPDGCVAITDYPRVCGADSRKVET